MNVQRLMPPGLRALPLLLLLPRPARAQQSYPLAGEAAIYDLVGNVRLQPGSGSDVVVRVQTAGRDAGQLRVQTGSVGVWRTLRVVFPDRDIAYAGGELHGHDGRSTITVRENGTFLDEGFWRDEAKVGAAADELLHSPKRRIEISRDGLDARADLVVSVPRGRHVAIFLGAGRIDAQNVDGTVRVGSIMGDVTLQQLRGAVTVRTISAGVRLTDVVGAVDASTISGSVALQTAREGNVRLHSISGGVHATDVAGDVVNLASTSGEVDVRGLVARTADLASTSGSVRAMFTRAPQDVHARSVSGSVVVGLPDRIGARVHMSSVSGHVESAFPMTVRGHVGRVMEGTIGDGAGRLDLSTVSGSVELQRSTGGA